MRGTDERSEGLFSHVSCEARVPADHPLRAIRAIVDEALEVMSSAFERLYSKIGRPSIAPEKLLRPSMDAPVCDVTVFTNNRERLLAGDVAAKFLATVLGRPKVQALLSDEHFSVGGTLIGEPSRRHRFEPDGERGVGEEFPAQGRQRRAAGAGAQQ